MAGGTRQSALSKLDMITGTLEHLRRPLNDAGWFIPPYVSTSSIASTVKLIQEPGFTQGHLEAILIHLYPADHLAAMATERIPQVPHVRDYKETIREAMEAHYSGLGRVAVSGLMPVVEGAGRRIAAEWGISRHHIQATFNDMAAAFKDHIVSQRIGAVGELISMVDSFSEFLNRHFYIRSEAYGLTDVTNRHGVSHGVYSDELYGFPISFFKVFACIEFLCFFSIMKHPASSFAPEQTDRSKKLLLHFVALAALSRNRPT